jgi:hypothetical protein
LISQAFVLCAVGFVVWGRSVKWDFSWDFRTLQQQLRLFDVVR